VYAQTDTELIDGKVQSLQAVAGAEYRLGEVI
jgi:hypothetical protein